MNGGVRPGYFQRLDNPAPKTSIHWKESELPGTLPPHTMPRMKGGFIAFVIVTIGGIALAETNVWYRISCSTQTGITGIAPDGQITWTNEAALTAATVERTYWTDGYWSRNFELTNITWLTDRCTTGWLPATNSIPHHETCSHNLFLIARAKLKYFQQTGFYPSSFSDLFGSGLLTEIPMCPLDGFYNLGYLGFDPACSRSAYGHTI